MARHQEFYQLLIGIVLACLVAPAHAESLDEEQARQAAAAFFNPSSSASQQHTRGQQLTLRSQGHEAGYYVFDRSEGGCVFVADDDAIGRAVLGYTERGSYDETNLPEGLRDWLDQVTVLMTAVHEGKINREPQRVTRARTVVVEPLIPTTWNQYGPYNGLCPMQNGKQCLTGCVATAMAQVMNYWRWPEHGYGYVSYHDSGCNQTLSQNLSSSYYDWGNMLSSYSGNYNMAQATAVATLMRDCGYAVQMHYTTGSSSACIYANTMQTYFHYSPAARDRYSGNYSNELWHRFIQQDLNERRPVLYSGSSSQGGHEFILDGYDSEGYYHVNWGWGGDQDGWFTLTNLNNYNDSHSMINRLQPDYSKGGYFSYTLYDDSVLTIKGSGIMPKEYQMMTAPWRDECDAIRKIVISEGITSITEDFGIYSDTARTYCFSNLKEVSLPEGLLAIGEDAFYYAQLSEIKIPSTVVKMDYALSTPYLKSLHLPAEIEEYKDWLKNCEQLTVDKNNPWLMAKDNILYSKDGKYLYFLPQGLKRFVIAETTERIYDSNLFCGTPIVSKCMKAPSLPNYVIEYPEYAVNKSGYLFIPSGAAGYKTWQFYLPSGWTVMNYTDIDYVPELKIDWNLSADSVLTLTGWGSMSENEFEYDRAPYFEHRVDIRKLVVGEGINKLCWDAFWGYYEMTEMELPSTLSRIESYCFGYTRLNTITCLAKTAPALGEDVFRGLPENGILRVPKGATNYGVWLRALPEGWKVENITPDPLATAYLCTGEERPILDLKEWDTLLKQYPNTVGIINPQRTDWAYLTSNMLIGDSVTGVYRCPYFQLSDLTSRSYTSEAPQTGFTTPVDFTVMKGEYTRRLATGYNTLCMPFDVGEEQLPADCRMYVYSHYDRDKGDVVFTPQALTAAARPCFVVSKSGGDWKADLAGINITRQQPSATDDHMRGTFVSSDEWQGKGYSPRSKDNIFAPLAQFLHPFRACLFIDAPNAPAEVRIRLSDSNDATGIIDIATSPITGDGQIYSLSGQRLSAPPKGQPYIKNGKIVIR